MSGMGRRPGRGPTPGASGDGHSQSHTCSPTNRSWLPVAASSFRTLESGADRWQALQSVRHDTFTTLINHLPARSLRPGLTRAAATDTAWVIASPDTYDMLVRPRGYTLDHYQKWVTTNLTTLLLSPPPPAEQDTQDQTSRR
jgi:hypothetical protein